MNPPISLRIIAFEGFRIVIPFFKSSNEQYVSSLADGRLPSRCRRPAEDNVPRRPRYGVHWHFLGAQAWQRPSHF